MLEAGTFLSGQIVISDDVTRFQSRSNTLLHSERYAYLLVPPPTETRIFSGTLLGPYAIGVLMWWATKSWTLMQGISSLLQYSANSVSKVIRVIFLF